MTVAVEVSVLATASVVVLAREPSVAWVLAMPAVALLQWGSLRASSWSRGFGLLSLVRRPLRWWAARRT